jgi:hypothetical protein
MDYFMVTANEEEATPITVKQLAAALRTFNKECPGGSLIRLGTPEPKTMGELADAALNAVIAARPAKPAQEIIREVLIAAEKAGTAEKGRG